MRNNIILLVEDNPDQVELTLRELKRNRVVNEVVVARDGVEALDYLFGTGVYTGRNIKALPTLILLDLKLPKMNGLEILRRLRAENLTKLIPTVILTSSDNEKDLIASYSLGANSFVRKPVDFSQFCDAVRQLGLYWMLLNESPVSHTLSVE